MSAGRAAVWESPGQPGRGQPDNAPRGTPQRNRFSRRHRWLIVAGISLLVLLGIGLLVFAWHFPFSRDRVAQSLEETFHGQVSFGKFRVTYLPHPGCVAENLTFVHPSSPPGSPPLVTVRKFTVRAHYIYLLFHPGYVSRIVLEGLHIQVPARSSGRSTPKEENPSNTRVAEVVANNALLEIGREHGKEPLRYEIHSLTLHSVSRKEPMGYDATFSNALPPGEIESHGHFGPWNSDDPGQTAVSGSYKFEHADLGVFSGIGGTLSSQDNFSGVLKNIEANGDVEVPDFKVTRAGRSFPLRSRYHAFVNAFNGDVRLEHVDSTVVRTTLLAKGSVAGRPGRPGKTTSLDLHVSDGRIQDLFRIFIREARSPFNGVISFRAHVEIPPRGRPFFSEVILKGDFGIEGGRFTKPNTQKDIATLSERAQGKKPSEKHKDENKESDKIKGDKDSSENGATGKNAAGNSNGNSDTDREEPERVISNLAGHVDLKDGVANFTKVSFDIPGALAHMHGTFNLLNDRVDFHGAMKTDANFSKVGGGGIKSIFLKPFDALFKKKPKGAEIPVRLTGTYSDPHAGVELGGGKKDKDKDKDKDNDKKEEDKKDKNPSEH